MDLDEQVMIDQLSQSMAPYQTGLTNYSIEKGPVRRRYENATGVPIYQML